MKGVVLGSAVVLLVGLCSAVPAGREFATSFMQNFKRDSKLTRFVVEVSALPTSHGSTTVRVTAVGKVYQKEVEPGRGVSFDLPDNVEMRGSKKFLQTVLIEATQDVTVLSLNYKQVTADTSVVYPVTDWGTEYYIFTPPGSQQDTFKEFSITNHKDKNVVEVILRGATKFQGKYYKAGQKLTMKLEPFETAQIQSQDDLSGTKVVSRWPVAVSSGHSCAEKYTTCNHVYEQLLPVENWGKEFIIAPLPYHIWGHDSVFVQASQATKLTINVGGNVQNYPLFAGQTIELHSTWPHSIYLKSDQGVQVLFEFNGGAEYLDQYFDPFLMTILPTAQFSTSYSLEGQGDFTNGVILVARNSELEGLKLDTKPLPANTKWHRVDGSDYSWAEFYYGTEATFNQIAHPKSKFGVYSFGVAFANGYGSPASSNQAEKRTCSMIKCLKDETCQMRGDTPTCVKKPPVIKPGTCWAMGDPHYHTFDGYYYNFMGNCTYTMAKNCHVDRSHPAFEVEAQNDHRAGSKFTFVGKVIIKVYGYSMTIVRSEFGLVRMNYTLWNLPISLDNGKVKLYQSGLSVVMETDFGLTVQYDWDQHLVITVAGSFASRMCGLCGNFNNKEEDDLTTPTGSLVSSTEALGKSWRVHGVADDAYCRDECSGQCESCESNIFEGLADRMFCGVLTHIMNGPFRDCHAVIEPKVFHEMCLYDVCMGEGMKNFLCDTLQVYSDACQRAGVKIHNWRRLAHCPDPTCTENSHYEFCGTACPATCENPDAPTKCKEGCVETCVCDEGFLLSGTKCVPKAQCGCMYEGMYYVEAGASFWTDDRCTKKCTCNPTNKKIVCESPGCRQGYDCKVVDGLVGCHPKAYAHCSVTGDPHYKTFDGYTYNFQGTCVYQMASVCSKDESLDQFHILVQNDAGGKRVGSSTKLVEVNVYGNSIVISREHRGSVLINGELTNLQVKLNNSKITVFRRGGFAEIKTDFGLQVSYDWHSAVFVTIPSRYARAMCGLCGNYNLNPKDDLQMRNGVQAASAEELGKSWRAAEIPGCVDGCKDKNRCPSCDITQKEKFETNDYCGKIRDPKGPFRNCHAIIPPGSSFDNCVYDVCLNNGNKGSWCNSLHTYTIACQQAGVEVYQWRGSGFCPATGFWHPIHSHYEHCASVCHATCDSRSAASGCKKPCQEGWVCDDGFILSGEKCVSVEKCGCKHRDKYYKHGQVFYPAHCQEKCVCNGTVHCEKFSCGPYEKCGVKNGVRSCQPVGKGVCSISGDPHYNTFDNSTYDFQGTCTYTAAEACGIDGTRLNHFSVVVDNEKWPSNPKLSVAKLVSVDVYGITLILQRGQLGIVKVNGINMQIPLNMDEQVQVYREGIYYVIMTDFGLRVTYDMVYRVTVTLPTSYKGKTCGLCGNFNDNKADEFQLPDGKVTKDLVTFGEAWKVFVPGVFCDHGCSGDSCPKCDSDKMRIFEKDCEIITDAYGPFAVCHNWINAVPYYSDCVFDACQSKGDRDVLCQSISAYMTDCQTAGVTIKDWRTPHFCPHSCLGNSHYQVCSETCASPCPGLTDTITCPTTCAEGCACDEGFYFNGTGCVRWDDCSCYHNGRTYKIGESVLSDDCHELCRCTAAGDVQCESYACKSTESCQVRKGSPGCFPKQCLMKTGGSITLFSGRAGTITAMGAYEIITHCDQSAVEWFRVVVKLQECSLTGLKSVAAVYVYFNDLTITVTDKQETWVNGKKVTRPGLLRNDISVKVNEKSMVVVEMKSGFLLSYSRDEEVTVTVSDSMVDKLCGACGSLLSSRDTTELSLETMQQYIVAFAAQDFPTCGL